MNIGILSTIGNTPLVELSRIFQHTGIRLFGKLEGFNPGGSIKDRPAQRVIEQGMEIGDIGPETTVIESSSGNMGIGLAQVCRYYKLPFICVVDLKTTAQNIRLLEAYGAQVEIVRQRDPKTGEYLPARIKRVQELLAEYKDSFWPNQYASLGNSSAHHRTMDEIVTALGGEVDYLFCAASTCGTLRGCSEYVRHRGLKTRIIAVDAIGSLIFGGRPAKRLIPGHGAAIVPPLFKPGLAHECIHVSDLECVLGCHRLVQEEALLCGGSCGAILSAIERYLPNMPKGATCVAVLPDRGERYLDTIYSPQWVMEHFGDISGLFAHYEGGVPCATATY